MTINKSQGQSICVVGIDLTFECFAHGQLYVALSRASDPAAVRIYIPTPSEESGLPPYTTRNVVIYKVLTSTSLSAATATTATTTAVQIDDGDKDKDDRSKKRCRTSSSTSSSSSSNFVASTHGRHRNAHAFWCDRCDEIHESNSYHDDDDSDSDDPDDSHSNDPDGIEKTIRIKVERGLQANPNTRVQTLTRSTSN